MKIMAALFLVPFGVGCASAGEVPPVQNLPAPNLPSLAVNPDANYWSGLSVGTSIFTVFRKGSKAQVGGAGTVGYDKKLANNFTLGIGASAGFAPYSIGNSALKGYNFATTDVKLGYDMGKVHPWVSAGVIMTKANSFNGYSGAGDSLNSIFGAPGKLQTAGTVGAGVDFQITNNLTMGIGVQAGNSPAMLFGH